MKVSVAMITFNHERFIHEAINSILSQKTDFHFELVLGEDHSTDSTRHICEEYVQKYPEKIRLLPSNKNLGMIPNLIRTFQACLGQYIAFLEGDDYWTDALKLQKQVDFLDANPDYGLVHTDFDHYVQSTGLLTKSFIKSSRQKIKYQQSPNYIKWAIMGKAKISTCTICFRKSVYDNHIDIEEYYNPLLEKSGDLVLLATISNYSKVKFFNESTALKRELLESASQSQDYKKKIDFTIGISNTNEYYAKKLNVPIKYTYQVQKRIAKRIIKTSIVQQDNELFNRGIHFKKVKHSLVKLVMYRSMFYLYPYLSSKGIHKLKVFKLINRVVEI
jgi:glycosyltransferase involved in cell wall biosynthesis